MCAFYVWYVHSTLQKEFKDNECISLESEDNQSNAEIFLN